jgi:hypothetical protein
MYAHLAADSQPFDAVAPRKAGQTEPCANPRTRKDLSNIVEKSPHLTIVGGRLSENALTARSVGGRTRLTHVLAVPPVQLVQTRIDSHAALVFSSALGGGMLEGDDYRHRHGFLGGGDRILAPAGTTSGCSFWSSSGVFASPYRNEAVNSPVETVL